MSGNEKRPVTRSQTRESKVTPEDGGEEETPGPSSSGQSINQQNSGSTESSTNMARSSRTDKSLTRSGTKKGKSKHNAAKGKMPASCSSESENINTANTNTASAPIAAAAGSSGVNDGASTSKQSDKSETRYEIAFKGPPVEPNIRIQAPEGNTGVSLQSRISKALLLITNLASTADISSFNRRCTIESVRSVTECVNLLIEKMKRMERQAVAAQVAAAATSNKFIEEFETTITDGIMNAIRRVVNRSMCCVLDSCVCQLKNQIHNIENGETPQTTEIPTPSTSGQAPPISITNSSTSNDQSPLDTSNRQEVEQENNEETENDSGNSNEDTNAINLSNELANEEVEIILRNIDHITESNQPDAQQPLVDDYPTTSSTSQQEQSSATTSGTRTAQKRKKKPVKRICQVSLTDFNKNPDDSKKRRESE